MRYGFNWRRSSGQFSSVATKWRWSGTQRAHLFGHAAAQLGIAGAERDDDRLRTFAEQAEDPLLHRVDLVNQSTAQAMSGVNDTTSITGV